MYLCKTFSHQSHSFIFKYVNKIVENNTNKVLFGGVGIISWVLALYAYLVESKNRSIPFLTFSPILMIIIVFQLYVAFLIYEWCYHYFHTVFFWYPLVVFFFFLLPSVTKSDVFFIYAIESGKVCLLAWTNSGVKKANRFKWRKVRTF